MSYDISDYVDVKTRLELFYAKYPEGSIQFEFMGVMPGNPDFIWGIAKAYRWLSDTLPATGTCSELAQGKTAFTRGSELANLETSAIGRAIGALGIGLGKSMASKQEVNSAKARQVIPAAAEIDPWLEEVEQDNGVDVPKCMHGKMNRKTGTNKETGVPFAGWVCHLGKCKAIWDRSK
jgi:hypothetical protein